MNKKVLNRTRFLEFLTVVKFVLIVVMLMMFITFNARIAQQAVATQSIAENTNRVVKDQADILSAIEQVTNDTHTTAAQQTAIIICMLQVPIAERTTDLQAKCRAQVGVTETYSAAGTSRSSADIIPMSSSSNTSTSSANSQSNTLQPTDNSMQASPSSGGLIDRTIIDPVKSIINGL